jgi:hypothetical protein
MLSWGWLKRRASIVTPNAVTELRTTKSGLDLTSFEDVTLYKKVPIIAEVHSLEDALSRLGHDKAKLLTILRDGLQAEATRSARESSEGWKIFEDGKETEKTFEGTLANPEDVNPVVLMFAKLNFGFDEIVTDPKNPQEGRDKKVAAKQAAKDLIRSMPQVLTALQKKAAGPAE